MKKVVKTTHAAIPQGAYSQAIIATSNTYIFCSGQVGIDPITNTLVDGLEAQTHQTIKNIQEILKAANSDLEHIVNTTIYANSEEDLKAINLIYESYFPANPPARTRLISPLPGKRKVLIEAVAIPKNENI